MVKTKWFAAWVCRLGCPAWLVGCSLVFPTASHQGGPNVLDGALVDGSRGEDGSLSSVDGAVPALDGALPLLDGALPLLDGALPIDGATAVVNDGGRPSDDGSRPRLDSSAPDAARPTRASWPLPGTVDYPYDYELTTDIVRDRVTGLEWQRRTSSNSDCSLSYDEALTVCRETRIGDYADWRLPTRLELFTISNENSPTVPTISEVFTGAEDLRYWSSTALPSSPNAIWALDFNVAGAIFLDRASSLACVRCVRGVGPGEPAFVVGEGVVFDSRTGLEWMARSWTTPVATPGDAEAICASASPDWRLPTVIELQSIVDTTRSSPAIDLNAFPYTPSELFWTSTRVPGQSLYRVVDYRSGADDVVMFPGGTGAYLRCVRAVR